jgi:hypothetical protein
MDKANYQKNTNLVSSNKDVPPTPGLKRVKTDGRIGSTTPPSMLKGGLSVNTNASAQSHKGGLGSAAALHMSPGHKGGVWSPRVAKARAQVAKAPNRTHTNPVNLGVRGLKRVRPD